MVTKPRDYHSLLERSQEYGGAQHGAVAVGVTSTLIIAAFDYRRKITLINDSVNIIYLSKGAIAVLNNGIRLNANGGSWIEEPDNLGYIYRGAFYGISGVAASNISFTQEY